MHARLHDARAPEHTHIPVSRRTPYPAGGGLPDDSRRTLEPFVALSAAAAVTSRIRLGIGICLVAQRDPIVTAKEVATLDLVAGGRFDFGIGVGWNEDEATHHGVDLRRRRALVREQILAMQRPWSDEVASFEGELVHLPTRRSSVARSKPGRTRATRPLDSAISSGSATTGEAPATAAPAGSAAPPLRTTTGAAKVRRPAASSGTSTAGKACTPRAARAPRQSARCASIARPPPPSLPSLSPSSRRGTGNRRCAEDHAGVDRAPALRTVMFPMIRQHRDRRSSCLPPAAVLR
ncbi:LLM class flavin-dependent oxidoreductase [Sorangium sp. KYC3313]|uniref:LLM class flavin-dependent oxidoreductase n=1 Tax=Sorangium sp. KYC3313 TaxID=3449740 RepID=UPI003F895034